MIVGMTCPCCGDQVTVDLVLVTHPPNMRTAFVLFCTGCPLVSELDRESGNLLDMPPIHISELDCAKPQVNLLVPVHRFHVGRDS